MAWALRAEQAPGVLLWGERSPRSQEGSLVLTRKQQDQPEAFSHPRAALSHLRETLGWWQTVSPAWEQPWPRARELRAVKPPGTIKATIKTKAPP